MRSGRRCWAGWLTAALVSVGLSGCANFWDEITNKNRPFKTSVQVAFSKPKDPIVVLRDSKDGDERARAIRNLTEPKQHGGTDQEQDFIVDVLTKAASTERQPLCRLAAVQKLGSFHDPRVLKGLEAAFYNVDDFSPDVAGRIQCQVLMAMGDAENPQAVPFLVEKLKEPLAERSDLAQQRNDRCIAAARALSHFKNNYQATEALLEVLHQKKEDVALRDRAHESLQVATGKNLPPDYQAWDDFLHPKDDKALAKQPDRKINLVGWLHD